MLYFYHSFWRICLIITSTIVFSLACYHTVLNIAKENAKRPNEVVHSKWILVLSVLITIWQAIWLIYGLTSIIRKSASDFFYKYPPVMHWMIYANFIAANILNFFSYVLWTERVYLVCTIVSFS